MTSGRFAGLLLACCQLAGAQAAFEVTSIRVHPGPITFSSDPSVRGRMVRATASTLLDLITNAYGVKYDQVSGGPDWINSEHYDIAAKAEGEGVLTKEQAGQMLQALLADRFQLKIHRETREVPVYALVVGKSGFKMKTSSVDAQGNNSVRAAFSHLPMEATHGTMEQLAAQLSHSAGRPVLDRTGLSGYYAYKLDWLPVGMAGAESNIPSIFVAVQEQLGLKLESTKAPYPMIVVDQAERASEN